MQVTPSPGAHHPHGRHTPHQAGGPASLWHGTGTGEGEDSGFVQLVSDAGGGLPALLQLLGVDDVRHAAATAIPVPVRRLHEGEALYEEGAWADAIYFVRAGTFKTYCTGFDGYEQVLGFSGPRDLLGFDAIGRGRYSNEAVALEECSVCVVLLHDFFCMPVRHPGLDHAVFRAVSAALRQRAEMAELMGAVSAEVRVARFLLQLSRRMRTCGQSGSRFHLRMSRRDIASYLGIAHETVSRSFSSLAGMGFVGVDNREVEILDMDGLTRLSHATRRPVDERVPGAA